MRLLSIGLILTLFLVLWYNHAWISDDSLITLRTVNNFVEGRGMVWNPGERVQVFTHPLWFLILSIGIFFVRSPYIVLMGCSLLFSLAALLLLLKSAHEKPQTILIFAVVLFSQAFIDYTSSGLENPLSYFLTILVAHRFMDGKHDAKLFLLMALTFLNRMDYALLLLPMALTAWYTTRFSIKAIIPAATIVVLWLGFAFFYFGYPLPNTYLAKLGAAYPQHEYYEQFWHYVGYTVNTDGITLVVIVLSFVLSLIHRSRTVAISLGVLLYFLYLHQIGGGFMAGRFFAVPFLISVFVLIAIYRENSSLILKFGLVILLGSVALMGDYPLQNGPDYDTTNLQNGIVDERGYYFPNYSIFVRGRWPQFASRDTDILIQGCGGIGVIGYTHNDDYIIDTCGLGSAYLSRLPAVRTEDWRIGHSVRKVPAGFEEWVLNESDTMPDAELTRYFEDIRTVISGPLWSEERLQAIWRINFTDYDYDEDSLISP